MLIHNLFLSIFLNVHIPNITFSLESAIYTISPV